jgi:hypothetical protein
MIEFVKPLYQPRWFVADGFYDDRPTGYYFYDETGAECYGPYETKEQCQAGLEKYALSLEPGYGYP